VEPPTLLATDSVPAAERRYSNRLPQDRLEFVPYVTSETHRLHDSAEDADQLWQVQDFSRDIDQFSGKLPGVQANVA